MQYSPRKMDYFHTISALHHKLLDYFTNVIGIIFTSIFFALFQMEPILKSKS